MSAYTVAVRGRVKAEALMQDACTIKHRTGTTTDGETGVVTPTYSTIYTGRCKVQRSAPSASPSDVGQASLLVGDLQVHVPTTVTGVAADDVVTITASVLDPALVGATYKVRAVLEKSYLTARRLSLIEVTS